MRIPTTTLLACAFLLVVSGCLAHRSLPGPTAYAGEADVLGIERAHQQDVAATVPGDPTALAGLWTDDAVRLNPGGRVDIGKQAIRAADERAKARHPGGRVVSYTSDIKDVRIKDGWAFEWGHFTLSYKETIDGEVKSARGSVLRVLQKQSDGSWKFARVMWNRSE
jgi:uncharacterized protein (TIGR02246 family)